MTHKDRQITNSGHKAIAREKGFAGLSSWNFFETKVNRGEFSMADYFIDRQSAHQGDIAAAAVIAGKAESVWINLSARMAQKMVVEEIKRIDVKHFLKANHVSISLGEKCRG